MRKVLFAAACLAVGSVQAQQPPQSAGPQTVTFTVSIADAELIMQGLSCPALNVAQKLQAQAAQQLAAAQAAAAKPPAAAPAPQAPAKK